MQAKSAFISIKQTLHVLVCEQKNPQATIFSLFFFFFLLSTPKLPKSALHVQSLLHVNEPIPPPSLFHFYLYLSPVNLDVMTAFIFFFLHLI